MKGFFYFSLMAAALLLSAVAVGQVAEPTLAAWLARQRWQQRVVLVCVPNANTPELQAQRQRFAPAAAALQERDITVREVLLEQLSTADKRFLTQKLGVKTTGFTLLLLGKDGGIKQRGTQPVTPEKLFQTIDVMPMRRQEARRSAGKS